MFTRKLELFTILGFRVSLDLTWFLLAVLIVWSLASGYFPAMIEGLDANAALWLGLGGALGLFLSIIFHEFAHAVVARRFDIPISGITLFIFGGVAEMEREPPSAVSEFLMAIAGPVASYILAGGFFVIAALLPEATAEAPLGAMFAYLATINLILATFNLLPAFPLDGGRVFRAGVWWFTGDLARATRMAAGTGRFLGLLLLALGVFSVVSGNFVAGMWQALIGLFIMGAAQSSETHMVMKTQLEDVTVRRLMVADPVAVPADTPVEALIEGYFYRFSHKVFPVVRGRHLLGCVTLQDVGRLSAEERARLTAADILSPESGSRTIGPDSTALEALETMRKLTTSRLMVTENDRLVGMLTMRDIMSFVTIRQQIGAREGRP